MEKEEIETRVSKIWLEKNDILHIEIKPRVDIELDDVKEIIEIHRKLLIGKKIRLLTDARETKVISSEARKYSAEETSNITTANAILVNSPLSRMIGNLFIGINKPSYPVKIFTSEDKAIEWLKGFDEKNNEEIGQ